MNLPKYLIEVEGTFGLYNGPNTTFEPIVINTFNISCAKESEDAEESWTEVFMSRGPVILVNMPIDDFVKLVKPMTGTVNIP